MTLTEAAKWAGKSRSAIFKAVKSGRISSTRTDDGEIRIDPAELERVYRPAPAPAQVHVAPHSPGEQQEIAMENAVLKRENDMLRQQLVIAEGREAKLLDLCQAQTRLLSDQRPKPAPTRPWWQLLRR